MVLGSNEVGKKAQGIREDGGVKFAHNEELKFVRPMNIIPRLKVQEVLRMLHVPKVKMSLKRHPTPTLSNH